MIIWRSMTVQTIHHPWLEPSVARTPLVALYLLVTCCTWNSSQISQIQLKDSSLTTPLDPDVSTIFVTLFHSHVSSNLLMPLSRSLQFHSSLFIIPCKFYVSSIGFHCGSMEWNDVGRTAHVFGPCHRQLTMLYKVRSHNQRRWMAKWNDELPCLHHVSNYEKSF